jgi:hypothetical protein
MYLLMALDAQLELQVAVTANFRTLGLATERKRVEDEYAENANGGI